MSFIKSMSLRYRIEMLSFIVVMFLYQKYFIDFTVVNNNMNDNKPEWFALYTKIQEKTITPSENTRFAEINARGAE